MDSIKIKCCIKESLDIYKYKVLIYDSKNNLLLEDYTNEKGYIYFTPTNYGIYKILVYSNYSLIPNLYCRILYVYPNYNHYLTFTFNKFQINHSNKITINLVDQNYEGLPIMKGEINLCQNHIQFP